MVRSFCTCSDCVALEWLVCLEATDCKAQSVAYRCCEALTCGFDADCVQAQCLAALGELFDCSVASGTHCNTAYASGAGSCFPAEQK